MKKKILISTGGSGGHVIPAMSFYDHLKDNFEVFLITDVRGSKFINSDLYKIKIIDIPDFRKNILKAPLNLIFFFISVIKSFIFLKKNKIDQVISTGGYMTLPVCIASRFLKSKLFLFEPNMVLGRANSIFIKQCQKIFCYSNKIRKFPKEHHNKIKIIFPIIKKIYLHKKNLKKTSDQKIFLIIGGSQGAKFFQTELKNTVNKLSGKHNIFIYHQTNKDNFKNLEYFYKKNNIPFNLFDFNQSLEKIYIKTDFCITRAGASTLAELVYFNVPFLAIPFPYSKDDHQLYNAKFYKDQNCCWLIEQKDIFKESLFEIISDIIVNQKDIQIKRKAMYEFSLNNTWENNNKLIIKTIYEN